MITKTYAHHGAGLNLRIVGTPGELTMEVNHLFNSGAITNIPDTYKENSDDSVTVQSDRVRFLRGFIARGFVAIQSDKARLAAMKGKPGGVFKFAAIREAAHELATWEREHLYRRDASANTDFYTAGANFMGD